MPLTPPQEAALNALKAQAQADKAAAENAADQAAVALRQHKKDRVAAENIISMIEDLLAAAN